jgi:hypothetical protein
MEYDAVKIATGMKVLKLLAFFIFRTAQGRWSISEMELAIYSKTLVREYQSTYCCVILQKSVIYLVNIYFFNWVNTPFFNTYLRHQRNLLLSPQNPIPTLTCHCPKADPLTARFSKSLSQLQ